MDKSYDFETKIIRSKRRTLGLQVLPDKTVLIKVPLRISVKDITRFIDEHTGWIEKQLCHIATLPVNSKKKYKNGENFFYLGTLHTLEVGDFTEIMAKDNKILFPEFLKFRIEKELTSWYIKQAKALITEQVEWNATQMKTPYQSISFADTKSRWGACTHDNRLQFNWRLVMAPFLVIRYVVIHELVHTVEKNHSADFWSRVKVCSPSHKLQRKWLKEHGELLKI